MQFQSIKRGNGFEMANMKRKNVIVTGGSQGIGKSIVRQLAITGYHVYICARNGDKLQNTVSEFSSLGVVECIVLDLSCRKEIKGFCEAWNEPLYALINNAGICLTERIEEDLNVWDNVIDVNLNGLYFLTKGLIKHMVQDGRIINISSQLGREGRSGYSAYCASKFALIGLTNCWAKELGVSGITVNAICPGWVNTEMASADLARMAEERGVTSERFYKEICESLELKRFTEPGEIANLVEFLVSEKASGITGREWLLNTIWNQE